MCRFRIETERLQLLDEPFALLRIVVRICFPLSSLQARFSSSLFAVRCVEPFAISWSLAPFSTSALKSSPFTPLKPKSMLSSGQSKWYSPMLPAKQRATFVDRPAQNCVTADPHSRTARRFLRQIFSVHFVFMKESKADDTAAEICAEKDTRFHAKSVLTVYESTKRNYLDDQWSDRNAERRPGRFSPGIGGGQGFPA